MGQQRKILNTSLYALMMDDKIIGKFEWRGSDSEGQNSEGQNSEGRRGKINLTLEDGVDINHLPYILKINIGTSSFEEALVYWIEERLLQRNRIGIRSILKELEMGWYNKQKLFQITHASLVKDPYWIAFKPEDRFETCSQRGRIKSREKESKESND